jgi:hypothetical protein
MKSSTSSQKISCSASSFLRLPWPPARHGVTIPVCESPAALYSVVMGISEWHLTCPRPWIYFLPIRREHGHEFGERCGAVEKLTLFSGLNGSARVQAQMIFERLCMYLRRRAAKENEGAR